MTMLFIVVHPFCSSSLAKLIVGVLLWWCSTIAVFSSCTVVAAVLPSSSSSSVVTTITKRRKIAAKATTRTRASTLGFIPGVLGSTASFITTTSSSTNTNTIRIPSSSSSSSTTISMSSSSSPSTTSSSTESRMKPKLDIPPPLLSTTPGTWAYDTMTRRIDEEILQRTYDENKELFESDKYQQILQNFNSLRNELQHAMTTPITYLKEIPKSSSMSQEKYDELLEEQRDWNDYLKPFVTKGCTWCSTPWLVAEFYVYRKLMEALEYFDPSSVGYQFDPFYNQKQAGLVSSIVSAEGVMKRIEALPTKQEQWKEGFSLAIELALWGNKMDLSLWPASTSSDDSSSSSSVGDEFAKVLEVAKENLLHDDTNKLLELCEQMRLNGGGNIDIVVDNAGFELVTDLALADHLIADGIAQCVTFQCKKHPTFVSDALEKDVLQTIDYYANQVDSTKYPYCQQAGKRWQSYIEQGQWKCHEDFFWVQGKEMWNMPDRLKKDLNTRCDLVFVKGDANYRRLLGDRMWDYSSASFEDVVGYYFPTAVCALRTLKAEVACGLDAKEVERAKSLDPKNWLTNGRFGVIHYGSGIPKGTL